MLQCKHLRVNRGYSTGDLAQAVVSISQGSGDCWGLVSAASPICSDFQTFCPDWLHFGHFLCFGGIAASQLSLRIFPIYF